MFSRLGLVQDAGETEKRLTVVVPQGNEFGQAIVSRFGTLISCLSLTARVKGNDVDGLAQMSE